MHPRIHHADAPDRRPAGAATGALIALLLLILPVVAVAQRSAEQTITIPFASGRNGTGYEAASVEMRYAFIACSGQVELFYAMVRGSESASDVYWYRGDRVAVPPDVPAPRLSSVVFAGYAWRGSEQLRYFRDEYAGTVGGAGCLGQTQTVGLVPSALRTEAAVREYLNSLRITVQQAPPLTSSAIESGVLAERNRAREDSLARAAVARRDSLAREAAARDSARQAERARRDSLAAAAAARDSARRERERVRQDSLAADARDRQDSLAARNAQQDSLEARRRAHEDRLQFVRDSIAEAARERDEAAERERNRESPDEARRRAEGARWVWNQAEGAFASGDYARAVKYYQNLLSITYPEYAVYHSAATQRLAEANHQIMLRQASQIATDYSQMTGLSLGPSFHQSMLGADGGLVGLASGRYIGPLHSYVYFGGAGGVLSMGKFTGLLDAEDYPKNEQTAWQANIGGTIPWLQLEIPGNSILFSGRWAPHVAYVRETTTTRSFDFVMGGIMNYVPSGGFVRLDAIVANGKPYYGLATGISW